MVNLKSVRVKLSASIVSPTKRRVPTGASGLVMLDEGGPEVIVKFDHDPAEGEPVPALFSVWVPRCCLLLDGTE